MKRKIIKTALWVLLGIAISDLIYRHGVDILTIPTSSMEKSIIAGEYVWVNKLIPGPRFYANNPDSYRRWRIWRKPDYNDIIVFNFPDADTIVSHKPGESYYMLKRRNPKLDSIIELNDWGELNALRVNQRPRMIKRVMGLPGDTITIRQGRLYVNQQPVNEPPTAISSYSWLGPEEELDTLYKITGAHRQLQLTSHQYRINLSNREIDKIGPLAEYCQKIILQRGISDPHIFPYQQQWRWNSDNMGPVYLPQKGDTIELTPQNLPLYRRMIEVFEETPIEIKGNYLFSNNIPISRYIFKMDYYWTHGDNRPQSFDSRFWGPVPENHIVGVVIGR